MIDFGDFPELSYERGERRFIARASIVRGEDRKSEKMAEGRMKDDGGKEIQHRLVELNVFGDVKNWRNYRHAGLFSWK